MPQAPQPIQRPSRLAKDSSTRLVLSPDRPGPGFPMVRRLPATLALAQGLGLGSAPFRRPPAQDRPLAGTAHQGVTDGWQSG